jgi:hypothetical protein
MPITPKEALTLAKEALDLKWTVHQEIDVVTGVVEKLAGELGSAEPLLRTVQVLWLPTGAKNRASAKRVLALLTEGSAMLAQGESAVGWAKVAAWAALRIAVEADPNVAAVVSLMRSASEWTSLPERYGALVRDLFVAARNATAALTVNCYPAVDFGPYENWPTAASIDQSRTEPAVAKEIQGWSNDTNKLSQAVLALRLHQAALVDAVQQLELNLRQPPRVSEAQTEPLELLWWGQALYSQSLHESYRDVQENQRLFWMADDMAKLGGKWPSEQRVAYFTETLRRAGVDLAPSRSLREQARDLVGACGLDAGFLAPPDTLVAAIEADPTGLPVTLLSLGSSRRLPHETLLAALSEKADMPLDLEVSERHWATWVCRERLLLRFLQRMEG